LDILVVRRGRRRSASLQFPPLHVLLRRAKLDVEAYSMMLVTHKVGNPNAQLHLIISNAGGTDVQVRSIVVNLRRGAEDQFALPAQNYLQLPSDKAAVLLTPFRLKPEEEWAHIINFLNFFPRQDEQLYRQLEANLREDINAKLQARGSSSVNPGAATTAPVTGDDANVRPLIDFFRNKFRWQPGEYTLDLHVEAKPERASVAKQYRFTLFESDSRELQDYSQDYKFGFGVFIDVPKHAGRVLPLNEA